MLIDVRIVCAHDAAPTAQKLQRLLAAEGHQVELTYGRASLTEIPVSRARKEALVLIWSERAQAAFYPLQWAQATEPERLIELAFHKDWPPLEGRAEVIEFMSWSGQRGGACWRALQERLRSTAKIIEPPKPQPRKAAMVLIGASMLAAGGAVWARMDADRAPLDSAPREAALTAAVEEPSAPVAIAADSTLAQGGPLTSTEPDDYVPMIAFHRPRIAHLALADVHTMRAAHFAASVDFSQPNFFERIFDRDGRPERSTP